MRRTAMLMGLAVASLGLGGLTASRLRSDDDMLGDDIMPPPGPPMKKRKPVIDRTPHPAMPEGGWPETRQQRRARERAAQ